VSRVGGDALVVDGVSAKVVVTVVEDGAVVWHHHQGWCCCQVVSVVQKMRGHPQ
jgi:hypothetical protein